MTLRNNHIEHAEDMILIGGIDSTRKVINTFRQVRDILSGESNSDGKITIKWDGAPSIFAGIDPRDGEFFVAKKSIFNKSPKVYKTIADIDADTSGDLNVKMKLALKNLSALGIEGVIQGDFLYSKEDIKTVDISGKPHITFHPNTIVYAIPAKSELAKQIKRSELGVVWHTTYRGSDFESMSASFGEKITSGLKKSPKVWSVDATYNDVSGSSNMTDVDTKEITAILSKIGVIFKTIDKSTLDGISENPDRLMRVKAFINAKVRENERIDDPKKFVTDLMIYMNAVYQKEEDKLKTEAGKEKARAKRADIMSYFDKVDVTQIIAMFTLYKYMVDAKHILIKKLDSSKSVETFLLTKNGYEVTEQEGFVVIDPIDNNVVKLVDRLNFSRANFSPDTIKGWQR